VPLRPMPLMLFERRGVAGAETVIVEIKLHRMLAGCEGFRPLQRTRFRSTRFQRKTGLPLEQVRNVAAETAAGGEQHPFRAALWNLHVAVMV